MARTVIETNASTGEVTERPMTPEEEAEFDAQLPSLEEYAAQKRWELETGGIIVMGAAVDTSLDSQSMIAGAYAYSQTHPEKLIRYKTASGFVTLDAAGMASVAAAVGDHVQECFEKEAYVLLAISEGEITTREQIAEVFAR